MKRILIFSLAYYPSHVSGAEAAVKEITDRIDTADIGFEMVTLLFDAQQPRTEKIGNVTVHRIGVGSQYLSKILFVPLAALTARSLHRKKPFDGMWAMLTYMLFPLVSARIIGVRAPYVITLQDGDPYEKVFERWFIRPAVPLLDYGFRHASVVQAISQYLATWPGKRGASVPVVMIHNGGNPNDFKECLFTKDELLAARRALGVQDNDVLLGNTARLVYQKGWEDCLRALTELPAHIKLLVVGDGPDEAKYRALVAECGLESRVIFTGHVDRSIVTKYRRMLDIFVMPSRSEGLGNAGLSALASHIPLVATREGGLAEYVFDTVYTPEVEQTAWVVDKDSPEQIADRVRYIMEHRSEVEHVSDTAQRMVRAHYQWDSIARDMREKVFARLFGVHT